MQSKISVLMPVHNAEAFIGKAIISLLEQSMEDWQLIIIDDGSTDNSVAVAKAFTDKRISILHFPENVGIAHALNRAIEEVDTPYIARMDADDIAMSNRFERQYRFLENNKEVGICGSYVRVIETGNVWYYHRTHEQINAEMIFSNPLAHPAIMMRTSLFKETGLRYRDTHPHMEDYDLWSRFRDHTRFANIDEVLLEYRQSEASVSLVNRKMYKKNAATFFIEKLNRLGIRPTARELNLHTHLYNMSLVKHFRHPQKYRDWLDKLIEHNKQRPFADQEAFENIVRQRWKNLFFYLEKESLGRVRQYLQVSGKSETEIWYLMAKMQVKSFLGR